MHLPSKIGPGFMPLFFLHLVLSDLLELAGDAYGTLQLYPEPLFVLSTDNVYLTSIAGTANGRIFLAGKDSCLYEVAYQVYIQTYHIKPEKKLHILGRDIIVL